MQNLTADEMIPLWMRCVISLCQSKGGRITSEEIANVAATAKRYTKLGWVLVNDLRRCKHIRLEVIGEETNERHLKIKVYRVTRQMEPPRTIDHETLRPIL